MKLTRPFVHASTKRITQTYHPGHQALDFWAMWGTPLVAPEDCKVERIVTELKGQGEGYDESTLERGYGVWLRGLETGLIHLYWHTAGVLPVFGGEEVKRGQIVAFMSNSGYVISGGSYVPLEERNDKPYRGTHLHWNVYPKNKKIGVYSNKALNPLDYIDWDIPLHISLRDRQMAGYRLVYKIFKYRTKLLK
jgi:murein DD-endopeptidase MepM/ murein hydrolase activator NlpD